MSATLDLGWSLDAALGTVDPSVRPVVARPGEQYVSSGPLVDFDREWLSREDRLLSAHCWHGRSQYEAMYRTPVVGSSFDALRAGVLANGVDLLPAVKQPGVKPAGGQEDGSAVEAAMAAQIADSNARTLSAWAVPLVEVLWEMMEAMYLGHVMSEVEDVDLESGPDAGLRVVTGLRVLPVHRYRFLVDDLGRVGRIGGATAHDGWKEFDPQHFAWLTWAPHRGDPRGRSLFQKAHFHWRMLMDLWPECFKGWKQFGVPMMYGETAPGAVAQPEFNRDGSVKFGGKPVAPHIAMAWRMAEMVNGSRIAGPNGSGIHVVESSKDSSVVSGAVAILEAQIVRAILLQLRATVEARHGSKADSETGQDILGTLLRYVRNWLGAFVRDVLRRQNAWNYGDEIAARLTPLVDLGGTEHQDFAANSAGVGVLYQAGYFTQAQLPYVDTFLGLPQRQPGDLRVGPQGVIPDTPAPDPNAPPATDAAPPARQAA